MKGTPLGDKRARNIAFERLAGEPSKYTKPWDPPNPHPIAWAMTSWPVKDAAKRGQS